MADLGKLLIYLRQPDHPQWACGHRRNVLDLSTSPWVRCPACEEQDRRNRRHWQGFALGLLIAFGLTWLGLAASCAGGGQP